MAKNTNLRLSDDDRIILEALASDWRMSQRAVVSELLHRNDPRGGVHVEPYSSPSPEEVRAAEDVAQQMTAAKVSDTKLGPESNDGERVLLATRKMPGSFTRSEMPPKPAWKTGPVKRKSGRTLTGRPHGAVPKGGKK